MLDKVKIGPIEQTIKMRSGLSVRGREMEALAIGTNATIVLDPILCEPARRKVLWHEIIHVLLRHAGDCDGYDEDETEGFIDALAYGITGLLNDNPAIRDPLTTWQKLEDSDYKIHIHPMDYTIKVIPVDDEDPDSDITASWHSRQLCEIYINDKLVELVRGAQLWIEMFNVVLRQCGYMNHNKTSQRRLHAIGYGIIGILRDNPELREPVGGVMDKLQKRAVELFEEALYERAHRAEQPTPWEARFERRMAEASEGVRELRASIHELTAMVEEVKGMNERYARCIRELWRVACHYAELHYDEFAHRGYEEIVKELEQACSEVSELELPKYYQEWSGYKEE